MSQRKRTLRARLWSCARFLMISLLLCEVVMVIQMLLTREGPTDYNPCYLEAASFKMSPMEEGGPIPLEDILLSDEKPLPGKAIFFHETSCPCSDPQYNLLNLNTRHACAIESAALHNSNLDVYAVFVCPSSRIEFDPIVEALLSYTNVKLRRVNLWNYAEDTPMENWIQKDSLFRSRFLASNISDLLRFLSLFRFGGIYLDLDVIVLRSLEDLPINFVVAESDLYISSGVIGLDPNGFGHKLAELLLRSFLENYNGDIWAHNGPRNMFVVMTHVCDTDDVILMQQDLRRCHGIKVFPLNKFYEIRSNHWTHFFEPKFANETVERLKNSYLTHFWNHFSSRRSLRIDSQAAYILLAAKHCPKVLAATKDLFD